MNIRKYLNNQNWNIGFAQTTPKELLKKRKLPKVKWMRHNYRDRFFADPFILSANDSTIRVLAEELIFGQKGTIVCLTVDAKTFSLLNRKEILKLETHLSYPLIERKDGKVIIYPENSESGVWKSYYFDETTLSISENKVECNEALTDATILTFADEEYVISTIFPKSLEDAYLYSKDESSGKWQKVCADPIVKSKSQARMGGDFFYVDGKAYRPAQNCNNGYGKSLTICEIVGIKPKFDEKRLFELHPISWRYNLGLHTLNFHEESGLAVIDSYGFLYPVMGRIMMALYNIKKALRGN